MPQPVELLGELFSQVANLALEHTRQFISETAKEILNPREYQIYMAGHEATLDDNLYFKIEFTTQQARRLEEGHPSFDMKARLLTSPKALANKAKSSNRVAYLDVPFRMMGPHPDPPVGNVRQRVPQYVAAAMDALRGHNTRDRFRAPKDLIDMATEQPYQKPVDRIFEGLLMHGDYQMAQDPQRFPTRFATIRRVSEHSPTDKWIYPARLGLRLAPEAEALFKEVFESGIKEVVA